jgi:hypothetical protein
MEADWKSFIFLTQRREDAKNGHDRTENELWVSSFATLREKNSPPPANKCATSLGTQRGLAATKHEQCPRAKAQKPSRFKHQERKEPQRKNWLRFLTFVIFAFFVFNLNSNSSQRSKIYQPRNTECQN